jgi:hypothetical protein
MSNPQRLVKNSATIATSFSLRRFHHPKFKIQISPPDTASELAAA